MIRLVHAHGVLSSEVRIAYSAARIEGRVNATPRSVPITPGTSLDAVLRRDALLTLWASARKDRRRKHRGEVERRAEKHSRGTRMKGRVRRQQYSL